MADNGPGTLPDGDEITVETIDFATRTLVGDMRDQVLEMVRRVPRQWQALSEKEQRDYASKVNEVCLDVVRRGVEVMAADRRVTISATLEGVKISSKGIEGKLVVSRLDPQRHLLYDCQGADILIVLADAKRYSGERAAPKVDPDQIPMPLETLQVAPEDLADPETGELNEPDDEAPADAPSAGQPEVVPEPVNDVGKDPFKEGRIACFDGRRAADNPYPTGSKSRGDWQSGWVNAQYERQAASAPTDIGDQQDPLVAARELGAQAWRYGKDREENLYEAGTPESEAWVAGWDQEEARADESARDYGDDPGIDDMADADETAEAEDSDPLAGSVATEPKRRGRPPRQPADGLQL